MAPFSSDARTAGARAVGSVLAGCGIEAVVQVGPVCTVYRAGDALGAGRYALKEYCPQALCVRDEHGAPRLRDPDDAAARAAFEAGRAACLEELRLLSRLRLPGLVTVLQASETQGSLCGLMPWLPGVPLDALPPPRDNEAVRELLLSLLEPLAQLHTAGLVHGGLQPRQLLWASGQRPVLLGFGSAARALRQPEVFRGAAPELRPEGAHLPRGPWTDLYALASTVLSHLGAWPWDGVPGEDEVAAAIVRALPSPAGAGHRALAQALQACLRASPTERPAGAVALRALLGEPAPGPRALRVGAQDAAPSSAAASRPVMPGAAASPVPPPAVGRPVPGAPGWASLASGAQDAGPSTAPGLPRSGSAAVPGPAAADGQAAALQAHAPMAPASRTAVREASVPPATSPTAARGQDGMASSDKPTVTPRAGTSQGVGTTQAAGDHAASAPGAPDATFARDAALDAVPDGRPGNVPTAPRRPAVGWRAATVGLLLVLGAGWAAWWGLGLWQAAQERRHMDQLLAEAAARTPASAPAVVASSAPETLGLGVPRPGPAGTPVPDGPAVAVAPPATPPAVLPGMGATEDAVPRTGLPPPGGPAAQPPVAVAPDRSSARPPPASREAAPPVASRPPAKVAAPGREEADSGPAPPVARAAGLPQTPLAACVTQAKSALERCMRQQCARPAWRGHVQCERWLEAP
jgi:hypothetical protein